MSLIQNLILEVHKYFAAQTADQNWNASYQNKKRKYHITLLCHFNFYMTKTGKDMKV